MPSSIRLLEKQEVAAGTMAFLFQKPANFEFTAGQFLDFTLIHPSETDKEGNTRAFSLASAPYENHLMIATRMRDTAFKRVLKNMAVGTPVTISKPSGTFILDDDASKPVVFLIGGIGITPVRSILLDATRRKLPHRLYLIYSNHTPADAAFLKELQELQRQNPLYKCVLAIDTPFESWSGETGYVNAAMIQKHVAETKTAKWYMSGPPTMVTAMRKILGEMKVEEGNICFEEFSGY